MPRYRARAQIFTDRLILPGQEFESELPPWPSWEPLDEAPKKDTPPPSSKTRRPLKAVA